MLKCLKFKHFLKWFNFVKFWVFNSITTSFATHIYAHTLMLLSVYVAWQYYKKGCNISSVMKQMDVKFLDSGVIMGGFFAGFYFGIGGLIELK